MAKRMETWWSGLTYLFAKEAGPYRPRGFESLRLRNEENREASTEAVGFES